MRETKSIWKKVTVALFAVFILAQAVPRILSAEDNTANWTLDVYYVNETSLYDTKKTQDFTLKYQMEFHTNQDLGEGSVEIRIPKVLLTYRDGTEILPADIAVPAGTPENPTDGKNTPFNYYEEEDELVFFNYKEMCSGSNAAFQVLYKNLAVMNIVDMTEWSLTPRIQVTTENDTETAELKPLTGRVDTYASLGSVTKTTYVSGQSYTPGLYTKKQAEAFLSGKLPEEYEEHFENYKYVVWEVKANGNGTQPFTLKMEETPKTADQTAGSIVGIKVKRGFTVVSPIDYSAGTVEIRASGRQDSWSGSLYVVTAYPAEAVTDGTVLNNEAAMILMPIDGKDPEQKKTGSASWTYKEYEWIYPGDILNVNKEQDQTWESWLEVFRYAKANQEDKGAFPFSTKSICRGYGYTHELSGSEMGTYREGSSYTISTFDDTVCAYLSSEKNARAMTGEDYYFSEVKIIQKDRGYDVWENDFEQPEQNEDVDQKLAVYAVFADTDPRGNGEWEHIADVGWNEEGEMTYSFTEAQLARKPWKVKAVHQSINYQTTCEIYVQLRLRYDSPVMEELLAADPDQIILKNSSGAEVLHDGGQLTMQDDAAIKLSKMQMHAAAYKTAKTTNDVVNGRAQVEYCLTAHDGYLVESNEDAVYLKQNGVKSPGRKHLVFYDLLPYGMRFDPSGEVIAGRLKNLSYSGVYNTPQSWDTTQVEVEMDSERDVIENYKGTGRTMVIFHLTYQGTDSSVMTRNSNQYTYWMEGWGVSFQAYYDWKDEQVSQSEANICAFMPGQEDTKPLLGTQSEVACDDGIIVPEGFEEDYKSLGSDINQDGITNIRNVLYARTLATEDIALASQSAIQKLVRADEDRFGVYLKSARVSPSGGYTYDITVTNTSAQPMRNIVIFDRLEHAASDRRGVPEEIDFEDSWWYGSFREVVWEGLQNQDIAPVVYYNEDREAVLPEEKQSPGEVLTTANGWYSEEEWQSLGKTADEVRAVAVDISDKRNGDAFILDSMESATFQIKMKAPENTENGAIYAYNNPVFYSVTGMNGAESVYTVSGNSVKVSLGGSGILEIEKQFVKEVPDAVKAEEFEFYLTRIEDDAPKYANQEYQLWRTKDDGTWEQVTGIYATDANGKLVLRAGEKAVFLRVKDVAQIRVEEEENPFWEAEQTDATTSEDGIEKRVVQVRNTYRPVLYVQKKLLAVPEGDAAAEDIFTFQLLADGEPYAHREFWYVDSVRTDGGIPQKVTASGQNGIGKTDSDGRFQIKAGEILALFPGDCGTKYTVKECVEKDADWICKTDTVEGILPVQGASASITNIYRWKNLYLTKQITHQDVNACTQAFTFRITDSEGNPVAGKHWVLLEEGEETKAEGILNPDGSFTCVCGGKTVKIEGLEAEQTYLVEETVSGELYEKVNPGTDEITMPLYSSKKEMVITNDYRKRSFSVSKQVIYDATDSQQAAELEERLFTMTVTVRGELLSEYPYTLTEQGETVDGDHRTDANGQFRLKDGQTAIFEEAGLRGDEITVTETKDVDYPQIYPPSQKPWEGELGDDTEIIIMNGKSGGLLIGKTYVGKDDDSKTYVEEVKAKASSVKKHAVKMVLRVTDKGGNTYQWPTSSQYVKSIHPDGTSGSIFWSKASDSSDGALTIEPWDLVYLTSKQMKDIVSYSLEEVEESRHQIRYWKDNKWMIISQDTPRGNQPVKGKLNEMAFASIINKVETMEMTGSMAQKRMQIGSEEVPEGARLVWRVEQYDGAGWSPAEGTAYLSFDAAGITCSEILKTGKEGKIILTKTANEFPYIQFCEDRVYLNQYGNASEGDLRIVELTEESDESWGFLVGYGTEENLVEYSWDLEPERAIAFVNGNCDAAMDIEKKMDGASDEIFVMNLKQVISIRKNPVTKPEDIAAERAAAGIPYRIYDRKSGKVEGEGITGAEGEIQMKAGQYARLEVPGDTLWTVSEQGEASYVLRKLSGTSEKNTVKLGRNRMLIRREIPEGQIEEIILTQAMVNQGVVDASTRQKVKLNSGDVVIPKMILKDGKVYVVAGIGEKAFYRNKSITGITFPDTIKTIGDDAFYLCRGLESDLVLPKALKSVGNRAFMECNYMTGELEIPESVVTIGESAFSGCRSLTGELKIPETVKEIGSDAFGACMGFTGTLVMPGSGTVMGERVFNNCHGITEVVIPEDITRIETRTFFACKGLKKVWLTDQITSIGDYAFASCEVLEDLKIGNHLETRGGRAFHSCYGLKGQLNLPSSIQTIGESAFYDCTGLTTIYIDRPKDSVEGSPWNFPKGKVGILWKE